MLRNSSDNFENKCKYLPINNKLVLIKKLQLFSSCSIKFQVLVGHKLLESFLIITFLFFFKPIF